MDTQSHTCRISTIAQTQSHNHSTTAQTHTSVSCCSDVNVYVTVCWHDGVTEFVYHFLTFILPLLPHWIHSVEVSLVAAFPSVFFFPSVTDRKENNCIKEYTIHQHRLKNTCTHRSSYTIFVLQWRLKNSHGLFFNRTGKQLTERLLSDHVWRQSLLFLMLFYQ